MRASCARAWDLTVTRQDYSPDAKRRARRHRGLGYTRPRYPLCIVLMHSVQRCSLSSGASRIAGERPVPDIVTEIPGPKARAHVAFDETWTSPSLPRAYPIVPVRGEGLTVEDIDGNLFLDFAAGIAVNSTGPFPSPGGRRDQGAGRRADPFLRLGLLPADLPGGLSRAGPPGADIGSRAGLPRQLRHRGRRGLDQARPLRDEAAVRRGVPRRVPRPDLRLGLADRVEGEVPRRVRAAPAGVFHAPYGRVEDLRWFDEVLFGKLVPADEVAAIIVEPIQGEGGYIVPEDGFLQGLRKICDAHGILLIADEIQSGAGRTGTMWAVDHWGVEPDILLTAKGIARGMTLGAMVAKRRSWRPGVPARTARHTAATRSPAPRPWRRSTCSKAAWSRTRGPWRAGIRGLRGSQPLPGLITDVRGKGLMIGIEFDTAEPRRGGPVGLLRAGPARARVRQQSVRMSPALTVSRGRDGDGPADLRRGGRAGRPGSTAEVLAEVERRPARWTRWRRPADRRRESASDDVQGRDDARRHRRPGSRR